MPQHRVGATWANVLVAGSKVTARCARTRARSRSPDPVAWAGAQATAARTRFLIRASMAAIPRNRSGLTASARPSAV